MADENPLSGSVICPSISLMDPVDAPAKPCRRCGDNRELLAALLALVVETERRDNPSDQGVSASDDVMKQARVAIARATGYPSTDIAAPQDAQPGGAQI